jgi:predicted RNase H-like nuclease (RuvC/YqgF family)
MAKRTTTGPLRGRDARARPAAARVRSIARTSATVGLLALAACAQTPAPAPEPAALQQRLQALEQRVEVLERYIRNLPSPPNRSRGEIERNIRSLEAKRAALLERYTHSHPDVREIDLSLRLLELQLQMMDQAAKAPE